MESDKTLTEFLSLVQVENFEGLYAKDILGAKESIKRTAKIAEKVIAEGDFLDGRYFGMPLKAIVGAEKRLRSLSERCIAYFSMEYGLATSFYNKFKNNRPISPNNRNQEQEVFSNYRLADYFFSLKINTLMDLPIYSGGLGVLAGDTVKTMADYKLPAAAVGMLWNSGYFRQRFWFKYGQMPEKIHWDINSYPGLIPLKNRIKISLKSEDIHLRLWKYYVYSYSGDYAVPLILLDSNIEPNSERNRRLTDQLYRSDDVQLKAMQRIILGLGGVMALKELGYNIDLFHLNEGHAVFAFVEKARGFDRGELNELKKHFVYTCHTPVEAGHDRFHINDIAKILKNEDLELVQEYGKEGQEGINLTLLAMNVSSAVNAVSLRHGEVMHLQFPKYKDKIDYVTNGVHPHTWISDRFKAVFDRFESTFKDWKSNPFVLKKAADLRPDDDFRKEIWYAHQANKRDLCLFLDRWGMNKDIFTVCWARRVAAYKRPSLILQDIQRLIDIAKNIGPIQVIFAGKAHPQDNLGFTHINEMLDKVDGLSRVYDYLKIIMLENYEMGLAKALTSSVDVWLNNPLPPFEASGTSGMKAILNGVLQMSTLDGWVVEAEDKNIGKIFGYQAPPGKNGSEYDLRLEDDSRRLYSALEDMVKLYYQTNNKGSLDLSSKWIDMMIDCIAAGAYFNTYRMLDEYKSKVWRLEK